jgi:hypothetical protein
VPTNQRTNHTPRQLSGAAPDHNPLNPSKLYDRRSDRVTLDEVERIVL